MKVYVASEALDLISLPEPKTLANLARDEVPVGFVRTLLAAKRALTLEYLEDAWLMPIPFAVDALAQLHSNHECKPYDTENEDDMRQLKLWIDQNRDRFNLVPIDPMEHFQSQFPEDLKA